MLRYFFIIFFIPSIVFAEIENARDLMEAGKFQEAMEELMPAARSGNADAEELIGIMYAMGLGVEQDDVRAFEWYLRSSMKGHPVLNRVLGGIMKSVEDFLLLILLELTCGMVCLLLEAILMLRFLKKKLLKK